MKLRTGGEREEGNVRKVPESLFNFMFSEIKNFCNFHFHPEGNGKLGSIFIFILREMEN